MPRFAVAGNFIAQIIWQRNPAIRSPAVRLSDLLRNAHAGSGVLARCKSANNKMVCSRKKRICIALQARYIYRHQPTTGVPLANQSTMKLSPHNNTSSWLRKRIVVCGPKVAEAALPTKVARVFILRVCHVCQMK